MANTSLCSVPGCGKHLIARGYCTLHYQRWKKGVPFTKRLKPPAGTREKFLTSLLGTKETACIPWPFSRNEKTGYGLSADSDGVQTHAHRVMCRMAHGEPSHPGLEAAHNCGKGHEGCVNPNHLRWATHLENTADKVLHGTLRQGSRVVHLAVLNESDIPVIRVRLKRGETYESIADSYGVTGDCIGAINRGQNWKHVK